MGRFRVIYTDEDRKWTEDYLTALKEMGIDLTIDEKEIDWTYNTDYAKNLITRSSE